MIIRKINAFLMIGGILIIMMACNIGSPNETPSTITKIVLPSHTPRKIAVIVADTPTVQTSPHGISTPTTITQSHNVVIKSLQMIDVVNGWAIGEIENDPNDLVLRTLDGGTTWKNVTPSEITSAVVHGGQAATAFYMDAARAWVIFSPKELSQPEPSAIVWKTQDSGKTWDSSQPIDLTKYQMDFFQPSSLGFTPDLSGWLMAHLGAGMGHDYIMVLTSQDGGNTWAPMVTPELNNLPMSCMKSGISFYDAKLGWITGNCPGLMPGIYFYETIDGGKAWQSVNLPLPSDQPEIFNSDTIGCGLPQAVLVLDSQFQYVIVRCDFASTNESQSWVYTSRDRGNHWQSKRLPSATGNLQFMTDLIAWYLGFVNPGGTEVSRLDRSIDGGQNWQPVVRVMWNGPVQFIDSRIGWVIAHVGQASTLVKTTNGGGTWNDLHPILVP